MLGRPEAALLATDLAGVLAPGAAADALAALAVCATGEPASFETTLVRADGEDVRAVVTASVVHGAGGTYLSVNVLDVTERRAAEAERRARREAELARGVAEAASRAKSDFLSALSHELRTPLQAVTGFTELLGTLDLSPARRTAALGHVASASSHILALVDDVLDIAAIEAGALPVHPADVDPGPLVGEVADLLGPLASERSVTVRADVAGRVRADPRRLRQVLINVVTNAVRYNRPGGSVTITSVTDATGVTLAVHDTGPGIPPELAERLFVPFDRLGADTGPEPGAGLGLVLARGLVDAMRGRLDVRSTPGPGHDGDRAAPARRAVLAPQQHEHQQRRRHPDDQGEHPPRGRTAVPGSPPFQGDPPGAGEHERGRGEAEHDLQLHAPAGGGLEEPAAGVQQHGVDHDGQQAGGREGGPHAQYHERARDELGEPGDPGEHHGLREAVALQHLREPADARTAPQAEHLLHAVREERPADGEAEQQQPGVGAAVPLQGTAGRSGPRRFEPVGWEHRRRLVAHARRG
jgi:signal transduction histidine kinase